jgi:hypothetical protein
MAENREITENTGKMLLVAACNCTDFARVHFKVGPLEEIKFDVNGIGLSNDKFIYIDDEYNIYILLREVSVYTDKKFYVDTGCVVIPGRCLEIPLKNPYIEYSIQIY